MNEERKNRIIKKGCPNCECELEYIGHNKFQCKKCDQKFRVKIEKKIADPNNSNTWTATCDECGGTMNYYNLKYYCCKCGSVLEV